MHVSENVVCYWILTLKTHIYIYLCTLTISEQMAKKMIIGFIDFFYPPFRKIMPIQTFRYAACGGANTLLDIFIFFISYNYILHKQVLYLGVIAFKPHIAAFIMSFMASFPTAFLVMLHVLFTASFW